MTDNNSKKMCATHRSKRSNKSAVEVCPEIMNWWDSSKNGDADPSTMAPGSHSKCYFKCPKCGKEMHREMYRFLIRKEDGTYTVPVCQQCSPTKPKHRVSLIDAVADIEKYWDYEKNDGKKPTDYAKASSEKVWTFCPICGTSVRRNVRYTWEADENGVGHVIHCRTCGKRRDDNSLMSLFPDIQAYWVSEKNEHGPEYYTISSGKKVYVKCPDCGHERQTAICDAVSKDSKGSYFIVSCHDCAQKKVLSVRRQRDSNIAKCCPDIMDYWDLQNSCQPKDLTIHSLMRIYTHCPSCNCLLYRRATNTFRETDGVWRVIPCQKCASTEAASTKALEQNGPLLNECPEIEEWWDFENNTIDLDRVTRGSHYVSHLRCPACDHHFKKDIHSFVSFHRDGRLLPNACSKCGYSSKGNPENNIVKECPDIVNWWNYEKNAPYTPEQFTRGSQFQAYLTCPDCGLELYTGIHSLLSIDENGSVIISHTGRCRKYRALASENNLVAKYPEVAAWWDYAKNNPALPEEYTLFSPHRAHFKCPECGTETYRRITDAFFVGDDGIPTLFKCPYCRDKKVSPGYNSFKAYHPDLIEAEWATIENTLIMVDPDMILDSYSNRVWWECPDCKYKYMMSVKDRLMKQKRGHIACPRCNGRRWKKTYVI